MNNAHALTIEELVGSGRLDLDEFLRAPVQTIMPEEKKKEKGSFSKRFAKGFVDYLPIYSSLKTNDQAMDAAMRFIDSKITDNRITGEDLWEIQYAFGVNNIATRKAMQKELANRNITIEGKVQSKDLFKKIGPLEIYRGENGWDTWNKNKRVSGETKAFFSGSLLAAGGAAIAGLYAGGTAVAGLSDATQNSVYSDIFGYALPIAFFGAAVATGDVLTGSRAAGMIANQYAAKRSKGDINTKSGKVASVLDPLLTFSLLGGMGIGCATTAYGANLESHTTSTQEQGIATGEYNLSTSELKPMPAATNETILASPELNMASSTVSPDSVAPEYDFSNFGRAVATPLMNTKPIVPPFAEMADRYPTEPLWGMLADADKNPDGIVTGKEINDFLAGRKDASDLEARYNHLADFAAFDGEKGLSVKDTQAYMDDYHATHMHNFRNSQRTYHDVGELLVGCQGNENEASLKFHFDFDELDPKTVKVLENLKNDETIGYVPDESDVVVRLFRRGDGTPIAIADIGSDGFSEDIIFRDGINVSEKELFAGLNQGKVIAEASLIDRQGTYTNSEGGPDCYNDDGVRIFDRVGRWGPREGAPRQTPTPEVHMPAPKVILPLPADPSLDGPTDTGVKGLIKYTSDRGWEGIGGKHPASTLEGKTMVVNSGDIVGVQLTNVAVAAGYDTQTEVEHENGDPTYGKKTLLTKAKNLVTPKNQESYVYKTTEHQDGNHGESIVLNGNNGIYGTESGNPDQVKLKYRDHQTIGGHKVFGKSSTLLGGVNVSEHENDYNLHTHVARKTEGDPVFEGCHKQKVHVEPMRNSTAYGAGVLTGAAGTYGVMSLTNGGTETIRVISDGNGIVGGQNGTPGITGGQ